MSAAALGLLAALTVESAMAYFTTYVSAGGSQVLELGAQTEIHEDVTPSVGTMTKHVTVENTSLTSDCFVRVKVFCGNAVTINYTGDGWYHGDGDYWYYSAVLPAATEGEPSVTAPLDVEITMPDSEEFGEGSLNVVVIQECTPAIYDEAGNPNANWEAQLDYQDNAGGEEAGEE